MPRLTKNEILELATQLPAVSTAATQLISIIENPMTSRNQIVDLLKVDEILFAECFKHANSAAVGAFRKFVTIHEIVDILGFSHIKRVALFPQRAGELTIEPLNVQLGALAENQRCDG